MRKVNLLPAEDQRQEQGRRIVRFLLSTFLPVVLSMILVHSLLILRLMSLEKVRQNPQQFADSPQALALQQSINNLKLKGQRLVDANRQIVEYFFPRPAVANILCQVGNIAAEKVWLSEVHLDLPQKICKLEGEAFNIRLVSEFMLALKRLPYFQDVELVTVGGDSKVKDEKVNFKLTCHLK